jgi:hypothetical protein
LVPYTGILFLLCLFCDKHVVLISIQKNNPFPNRALDVMSGQTVAIKQISLKDAKKQDMDDFMVCFFFSIDFDHFSPF